MNALCAITITRRKIMSFFKDFAEDLSQAVNELMPESTNIQDVETPVEMEIPQEDSNRELSAMEEIISATGSLTGPNKEPAFDQSELADMLKNIDDVVPATPVSDTVEEVKSEPVFASEAVKLEAAMASQAVTEPVVEKVVEPVMEVKPEPVVETPVEPVKPVSTVQPVFAPEPVVREADKIAVAPVFGEPNVIKEAPINTVKNLKAMPTGIINEGMVVSGDIKANGSLDVQGSITGNVTIEGKLDITGTLEGNISAEEVFADGAKIIGDIKCNGSVKIGQSSVVRGNITASAAVLAGAVKGDIDVQGPVILDSTAIIMGNIKSKSIQINNGAVIEGLCSQCYADVSPMSFFNDEKTAKKSK